MGALLRLSFRQVTGKWRMLLLVLLAALPIGLAIIVSLTLSHDETSSKDFADTIVDGLLIGTVMPLVCLVLATALFSNEVEDKTLNYLVLRPVPRFGIVLAKFTAAVAIACPLVLASSVMSTLLGDGVIGSKLAVLDSPPRAAAALAIAVLLGSVAYSSLFMWVGLMTTRALPYSLVYVVLWEGVIASFFSGIRYVSVRGFTLGIAYGLAKSDFYDLSARAIELPVALVGIAVVTAVFFYLTVRRLEDMDVP